MVLDLFESKILIQFLKYMQALFVIDSNERLISHIKLSIHGAQIPQ